MRPQIKFSRAKTPQWRYYNIRILTALNLDAVTENSPTIPPESYLQGLTLSEAIFEFGDAESLEAYNSTLRTVESSAPKPAAGMLDILSVALQGLQNIQIRQNNREEIEALLKNSFLNLVKKGDLIAFGFKMPRDIQDQPVKIPPDLFMGSEINWKNSELKSQNLVFSGIRVFENTGLVIDLTPHLSENHKTQIEDRQSNKTQEKKFPDLASDLHIGEKEAAEFLGISPRTLQGYRLKGGGPKYRKIGNRLVRYKVQDLIEWSDANKKENTSQK